MNTHSTPVPLLAIVAAVLAMAALALLPQLAVGAEGAPEEEPPATQQEAPAGPGTAEAPTTTPAEVPPVEEASTPEQGGEVIPPPPVEEVPPPAEQVAPPLEPTPVVVIVEQEVVQNEILVIPTVPDAPVTRVASNKPLALPPAAPPVAPVAPDPAPAIGVAPSAPALRLPAPTLADVPPTLPVDVPPAAYASSPPPPEFSPIPQQLERFTGGPGVAQSLADLDIAARAGEAVTAVPAVDPFSGVQSAVGPAGEPASLLQVLASYVIPGASGPASTVQLFLAFALALGAFAFARPRNWRIALPDVPGEPHAGHGSVGLRPG